MHQQGAARAGALQHYQKLLRVIRDLTPCHGCDWDRRRPGKGGRRAARPASLRTAASARGALRCMSATCAHANLCTLCRCRCTGCRQESPATAAGASRPPVQVVSAAPCTRRLGCKQRICSHGVLEDRRCPKLTPADLKGCAAKLESQATLVLRLAGFAAHLPAGPAAVCPDDCWALAPALLAARTGATQHTRPVHVRTCQV